MSFVSGLAHAVGDVVGPTLEGAGTAYDYLTPGKGSSKATNVGKAITNPNVTLSNPANLGFGQQSAFTYAAPASHPTVTTHTNLNTANTGQNTTTPSSTYDPAAAAAAAQTAAQYNQYGNEVNSALNDLFGQYNTAVSKENSAYGQAQNTDQSAYNTQKGNYDQAVTGQNQDLLGQVNQDREGVSNAYRNLMDLLGAYGGGASSVALQWAPNAAKTYQDKLVSGDQQTSAKNLASLANSWNDFLGNFQQRKQQELDQHNQNLQQAQADYAHTKGQLAQIMDAINNQSDTPGNIGTRLDNIEASIPNTVFVKPTYTGVAPTFTRPSLASFESTMPTAAISTMTMPTNSSATPVLTALLNQQKKQNAATVVPIIPQQKKTQVTV